MTRVGSQRHKKKLFVVNSIKLPWQHLQLITLDCRTVAKIQKTYNVCSNCKECSFKSRVIMEHHINRVRYACSRCRVNSIKSFCIVRGRMMDRRICTRDSHITVFGSSYTERYLSFLFNVCRLLIQMPLSLTCSILRILIRCIKFIKVQQMCFIFINVLLLYCGHQHVSATRVFIFRVSALRTRIKLCLNMSESPHSIKNVYFPVKIHF
jgi:hypothetical protein